MTAPRIPAAVVYGFNDWKRLQGLFPLFTRAPLPIESFPDSFRRRLHNIPAMARLSLGEGFGALISGSWQIVSIKVSLTRFWACSTASITMACPLLDTRGVVPLAPVHPEMPLTIALGYDDTLYGLPSINAQMQRVFTGWVDTLTYKLSPKGVLLTINMRDAIRFLVENKITKLYTLSSLANPGATQSLAISGPRDEIIRAVIKDGGGQYGPLEAQGPVANPQPGTRIGELLPGDDTSVFTDDRLHIEPSGRSSISVVSYGSMDTADGAKEAEKQLYNVMNRFPIEIIKHLSSLEDKPREFFADEFGNLHWQPRQNKVGPQPDGSTIWPHDFWFRQPVELKDTAGVQSVFSANLEWSTIGTINDFLIVNPLVTGEGGNIAIRGRLDTEALYGFPMASRTRFVFDDTLRGAGASEGAPSSNESAALLASLLMLWGKDVRAGSIEVEGNPTFKPGMPLRVWNMGLYPAPNNLFRGESVIHSYLSTGYKRGYRSSILFAAPEQDLPEFHKHTAMQIRQTIPTSTR